MKRTDKYPETSTFIYYNANPKNRITGDCWLRAICTALDKDYNQVLQEMVQIQLNTGYEMSSDKAVDIYLTSKGWVKFRQPRKDDNTKYTVGEFCTYLSANCVADTNIVCNVSGHHMVAIKPSHHGDGINNRFKAYDIWDCTDRCIGNYWTKKVI